jgi:ketosteroid isomerase-like protein
MSTVTTRSRTTTRSPAEVYEQHSLAMVAGELEHIVADYADDAIFITRAGVLRGKNGVRAGFTRLFEDLPNPRFDVRTRIFEGDVLFLEWSATSAASRADDGVETFVVRDGEIVLQTVHYTPKAKETT